MSSHRRHFCYLLVSGKKHRRCERPQTGVLTPDKEPYSIKALKGRQMT